MSAGTMVSLWCGVLMHSRLGSRRRLAGYKSANKTQGLRTSSFYSYQLIVSRYCADKAVIASGPN